MFLAIAMLGNTVSYATSCKQPGFDAANDGTADRSFWRTSNATYSWKTADLAAPTTVQYGKSSMTPVTGDWDGNGSTTLGAFSPGATSIWYTTTNPATNYGYKHWGTTGDIPVQGDYDGDNITDVAVFRPSTGVWYALRSTDNTVLALYWGTSSDVPVPGDYDGDLRADTAVYRPGNTTWYLNRTTSGFLADNFGFSGVIPTTSAYGVPR